jgi:LmbE family N-acetylglucosaminyl deacetylase
MVRASLPAELSLAPALIVAPHADDETFGCGGIIALKRRRDVPVTVVILTDGAASDPDREPAELIRLRQTEARAATALLGVPPTEVIFLGGPDGGMIALPADRRAAMVRQLAEVIAEKKPAEIFVPHRYDHHEDHEAANSMTRDAVAEAGVTAELLEYPIWMLWWAPLNRRAGQLALEGARRIDLGPAAAQKSAAINIYRSQLPEMPRKFMTQFTGGFELFFKGN